MGPPLAPRGDLEGAEATPLPPLTVVELPVDVPARPVEGALQPQMLPNTQAAAVLPEAPLDGPDAHLLDGQPGHLPTGQGTRPHAVDDPPDLAVLPAVDRVGVCDPGRSCHQPCCHQPRDDDP